MELPEGSPVGALRDRLGPGVTGVTLRYAVNEEYVGEAQVLKDGDEVALIPPVAGG
jgi:molybdopterin converting factor small subunit